MTKKQNTIFEEGPIALSMNDRGQMALKLSTEGFFKIRHKDWKELIGIMERLINFNKEDNGMEFNAGEIRVCWIDDDAVLIATTKFTEEFTPDAFKSLYLKFRDVDRQILTV